MDNTTVTNCFIMNYKYGYWTQFTELFVNDYVINNTFYNNTYGLYDLWNDYLQIVNNTFIWNDFGLELPGADHLNISRNRFIDHLYAGIHFNNAVIRYSQVSSNFFSNNRGDSYSQIDIPAQISHTVFNDNVFLGSLNPALTVGGGYQVDNLTFSDNIISNINDSAMIFYALQNSLINDNQITNVTGNAIHLHFNGQNNTVENNIIRDGSTIWSTGIYVYLNFFYGTIRNNIITNFSYPLQLYDYDPAFNNVYNNVFVSNLNTAKNWNSSNVFNISKDCSSTNIFGGLCSGGNYWGKTDGTGFSDQCADDDADGVCDGDFYNVSNIVDYLPLSWSVYYSFMTASIENLSGEDVLLGGSSRMQKIGSVAHLYIQAANTTEVNISQKSQSGWWSGIWGSLRVNLSLKDASGDIFYNWSLANVDGKVFASNSTLFLDCEKIEASDTNVTFSQLTYYLYGEFV